MERGLSIENYGKKEQKEWLANTVLYLTLTPVQQGTGRKSTCLISFCFPALARTEPSSYRRTSATERKYGYGKLLEKIGVTCFPDEGGEKVLSTVIAHNSVLAVLIKGLACTPCGACSLTTSTGAWVRSV